VRRFLQHIIAETKYFHHKMRGVLYVFIIHPTRTIPSACSGPRKYTCASLNQPCANAKKANPLKVQKFHFATFNFAVMKPIFNQLFFFLRILVVSGTFPDEVIKKQDLLQPVLQTVLTT
jgi:hypothetical protein